MLASANFVASTSGRCAFKPAAAFPGRQPRGVTVRAVSTPVAVGRFHADAVDVHLPDMGPAEYAVIRTPAGQQLVEEGKWFALQVSSQEALQASSDDGQLRFPAIAVKRTDGEFVKGKPFLADWVVEAELLDEELQVHTGSSSGSSSSRLGKVLVTRIKHTEETRRLIEEALRV